MHQATFGNRLVKRLTAGDYARTAQLWRESLALSWQLRDTGSLVFALEGLTGARAVQAEAEAEAAARLFGNQSFGMMEDQVKADDVKQFRAAEERLWQHYGVMPTERFVTLPGLNIQVRVLEVGQGEPVLFVHGSPNAGSKWAPLAAKLLDFHCLILDRPGCGLSEPVNYQGIDLRAFGVDLLGQTLDGLNLPQASVVASSLGGALAFYFTQARPERVRRLVQAGCPAFVQGFRVPFYNVVSSALSMFLGMTPSSAAAFRHLGHAAAMDRGQFASEVLVWRDALLKYTETARHENGLSRHMMSRFKAYSYDAAFLRQITPATLYLWGEDDPFGGVEIGKRCAAAQPEAVWQSFPASGHLPWLDDPDTHAGLIRAFLQGHS